MKGYAGIIAAAAHSEADVRALKQAGAELIFQPYFDAAEYAADKLGAMLQENEAPA